MTWRHRLIVRKLAEGCLVRDAASAAGIHRQTFWRWFRACPEFAEAAKKRGEKSVAQDIGGVFALPSHAFEELRKADPAAADRFWANIQNRRFARAPTALRTFAGIELQATPKTPWQSGSESYARGE